MAIEPDEIEVGHMVKTKDGVWFKIKELDGHNGMLKGDRDDVDGEEIHKLRPDDCVMCLTPHQFGQHKRFSPGGTGFSKVGRKLKHNRSKFSEQESKDFTLPSIEDVNISDFMNNEIPSILRKKARERHAELVEQVRSVKEASKAVARAFSGIVKDRELSDTLSSNQGSVAKHLEEIIADYANIADQMGSCDRAANEVTKTIGTVLDSIEEDIRSEISSQERSNMKNWIRNQLPNLFCPV